ncbi:hypothetical protein TTHT_1059 [Thermotomaculum hydrothermale]|uniref:Uncharacterized protein n=1 Tax=Thermotomaculum hydrothermale TaxID=981385 RepID=A0A7R6SZC5_9BACT|nr:DUF6263 family protein [Thermotomaculum hydrothermale]BBB32597.1 hypothetical protein TTHT_1059 [Thermotomaculum hydrothermale]
MRKILVISFCFFVLPLFSYQLKLNINKGDEFIYSIKKSQAMETGNGQNIYRNETESELVFNVKVVDSTKTEITLSFQLKKGKLKIKSPLGTNEFDTDKFENYPQNPFLATLVEMKSNPLTYVFDKTDFKVKRVSGFEKVIESVLENLKFKDKSLKKKIKKSLKNKNVGKSYGLDFNLFPYLNREITEGKEFAVNQDFEQGNSKIKAKVIYKVEKITDNSVLFKIKSDFELPEMEKNIKGLKAINYLKGEQKGSVTVNKDTGLPSFYSVKQSANGYLFFKETGEKIPFKVRTIVIIRFEKAK